MQKRSHSAYCMALTVFGICSVCGIPSLNVFGVCLMCGIPSFKVICKFALYIDDTMYIYTV